MTILIKGESTRVDEMNAVLKELGAKNSLDSFSDNFYYGVIEDSIFSVIPIKGDLGNYDCMTIAQYYNK